MSGIPIIHDTDWAPTTKPIGRAIPPSGNQAPTPANPADSAATAIAQLAGINIPSKPFNPILRGKLLTGGEIAVALALAGAHGADALHVTQHQRLGPRQVAALARGCRPPRGAGSGLATRPRGR